ncbi:MAG TPA: DUF1801 domain-containing protein [Kofleriaceae bacterium]|nr:DUF1801 domain-containing protein [Kofleriaceae bacterium]
MTSSGPSTVKEYLAALPPERRRALEAVRRVIRKNIPRGYEEGIQYGSIGYYVPLSRLAHTYNGVPLTLACLAAQKSHLALYLMSVYGDSDLRRRFEADYRKSGKKLDMGKACIRFQTEGDLPLDVIGEAIAAVSVDDYVAIYEASRIGRSTRAPSKRAGGRASAGTGASASARRASKAARSRTRARRASAR